MTPLRILVVEDEMTIALMIEDMLVDMGHDVVDMAMRLPHAVEAAASGDIDFAILDINLAGLRSFPVAEILKTRGVPFVFASGYGSRGLEPPYVGDMVLTKPFASIDLERAIIAATA